jgi:hypothetical protein
MRWSLRDLPPKYSSVALRQDARRDPCGRREHRRPIGYRLRHLSHVLEGAAKGRGCAARVFRGRGLQLLQLPLSLLVFRRREARILMSLRLRVQGLIQRHATQQTRSGQAQAPSCHGALLRSFSLHSRRSLGATAGRRSPKIKT